MKRNLVPVLAVALILAGVLFMSMAGAASTVAAPAAAVTPVAAAKVGSGADPAVVTLLDHTTVTDATGPCVNVEDYEKADIYYDITIDGGDVNTTTLTLQHGNTPSALVDGLNVAADVVTDATGLNQYALYGAYLCVKIDAASGATGDVTVSANALLK